MRAGDFEMADFEVDGKFTRIALLPMKTSTKTMRNAEIREKPFVLSQKVSASTKTRLLLPI